MFTEVIKYIKSNHETCYTFYITEEIITTNRLLTLTLQKYLLHNAGYKNNIYNVPPLQCPALHVKIRCKDF